MNLFLLRHGLAVEPGTAGYSKDADRPLTPKGARKLRRAAQTMKALDLSFDLILSSPHLRARQTAAIFAKALDAKDRLELSGALAPGNAPREIIESLHRLPMPGNVLLVGHEPGLSQLISLLVAGDSGLSVLVKKGGLCKLSAESLKPGRCATLEWLLTPKQMALMA
jgi:phosphohistidine phosphatase